MEENIKKTPKDWKISSFNDDCFKIIGSGINYFEGNKNYLSTSSIEEEKILFIEEEITYKKRPSRANMQPIELSIWFAKMKNTVKVFIAKNNNHHNIILSTGFCGIHSTKINIDYLKQVVLSEKFNNQKNLLAEGSTQEAVNNFKIKQINFLLPENIFEQSKIAEILSKTDNSILKTDILIEKQKRIKTGLIQDLLTKGIDEKGKIRTEETHKFKDSSLGRIPENWDCLELRKCIELSNNKRKPISAMIRSKMAGDYPYYGATGIIDKINSYNVEGEFVLFGEDGDHFLKWKKQEQTFLVNGKFNVSNHAHIVKGNKICSTKWIHYFFFHRDITYYLTRQGAGRFKLNKESLLSLPILVPKDINEQIKIIEKIEHLNGLINDLEIQKSKLQSIKKGLVQDLLSGKKRVTHLIN